MSLEVGKVGVDLVPGGKGLESGRISVRVSVEMSLAHAWAHSSCLLEIHRCTLELEILSFYGAAVLLATSVGQSIDSPVCGRSLKCHSP